MGTKHLKGVAKDRAGVSLVPSGPPPVVGSHNRHQWLRRGVRSAPRVAVCYYIDRIHSLEETNKKLRKEKKALDRDNKNAKDLEDQVIALSTKVEKETKRADDWRERHGKAQYAIQADDSLWKKAFRTMKRKHKKFCKVDARACGAGS